MANQWKFRRTFVLPATLVLLAISSGAALAAPVLVHDSREVYFAGGTQVSGCAGEGCQGGTTASPSFFTFPANSTFSGFSQWEVVEKVNRDLVITPTHPAVTTQFTYAVFNDSGNPSPDNIASFHVANGGNLAGPLMFGQPTGWVFTQDSSFWNWQTFSPLANGIPRGNNAGCTFATPLFCFQVTLTGNIPVTFNATFNDTSPDGIVFTDHTNPNWMVSAPLAAVPEPTSLLLLGFGLAGLGFWRRRRS